MAYRAKPAHMLFRRLSIRSKILAGFGMLVLPLLVLTAATMFMTREVKRDLDWISEHATPTVASVGAIQASGLSLIQDTTSLALRSLTQETSVGRPASGLATAREKVGASRAKLSGLAESLQVSARPQDSDDVEPRAKILGAVRQVIKASENVERLIDERAPAAAVLKAVQQLERFESGFAIYVKNTLAGEQIDLAERQAGLHDDLTLSFVTTGVVALLGIGLAAALGFYIARRIATPVKQLRDAAIAVGLGQDHAMVAVELEHMDADEVGDLATAFRDMTVKLREAGEKLSRSERLSAIGQVAGTVSHELRNPLAAIRNSFAFIQQMTAGKNLGVERALDRVDRNIDRCDRIIGDILEFTRAKQLDRQPVAIDGWLSDMLDEHEAPGGVPVERDLRSASDASIDGVRFRQVMVNLIDNAAQALIDKNWQPATGHAPRITVRTELAGPHVKLSVADNGPGIAEDKLPKIFEPLFTTKNFGVGLGLPTVRQLVEQHGGTVDVASRLGEGTTFTIWLPRFAVPASAAAAALVAGSVAA